VRTGHRTRLALRPSRAKDFKHGFAGLARFFPEGKVLTAQIEEALWAELYGVGRGASPLIFDDQYIASGGQLYELIAGHDRMQGDLRPLVFRRLGYASELVCHPYDICTAFLLEEAGGIVETPDGPAAARAPRHDFAGGVDGLCQPDPGAAGSADPPPAPPPAPRLVVFCGFFCKNMPMPNVTYYVTFPLENAGFCAGATTGQDMASCHGMAGARRLEPVCPSNRFNRRPPEFVTYYVTSRSEITLFHLSRIT